MKNFTDRPLYPNNDTVWDTIYDEAVKIIASCELSDISQLCISRDRADTVSPGGNYISKDDYCIRVFYVICERVCGELYRIFLKEENQIVFHRVKALTPSSDNFGEVSDITNFCRYYGSIEDDAKPLNSEILLLEDMYRVVAVIFQQISFSYTTFFCHPGVFSFVFKEQYRLPLPCQSQVLLA
ncbi:hypothetical protein LOD99_8038 [Oopsacas minuta]|uniref:Uncharacterized protein n=1 Tax=Oopsacas minuta TaxID=111878 RepID=A0AAV7JIA0_9METZ|nr:hypothetical protein LOD99_8038 [Oopsacas minuta]